MILLKKSISKKSEKTVPTWKTDPKRWRYNSVEIFHITERGKWAWSRITFHYTPFETRNSRKIISRDNLIPSVDWFMGHMSSQEDKKGTDREEG